MENLQIAIGYTFKDQSLLSQALTHSSYAYEHLKSTRGSNERLEFLGDAVLELVTSRYLYIKYPDQPEGRLTPRRASLVCEPALAYCAAKINLGDYLLLGRGEEKSGGRQRDSVTSDALEALIGAIYLDGGIRSASKFIHSFILKPQENEELFLDNKTALQELLQAEGEREHLSYVLTGEDGPAHARIFTVEARVKDRVIGEGRGRSKKAAEQEAAKAALITLRSSANVSETN